MIFFTLTPHGCPSIGVRVHMRPPIEPPHDTHTITEVLMSSIPQFFSITIPPYAFSFTLKIPRLTFQRALTFSCTQDSDTALCDTLRFLRSISSAFGRNRSKLKGSLGCTRTIERLPMAPRHTIPNLLLFIPYRQNDYSLFSMVLQTLTLQFII